MNSISFSDAARACAGVCGTDGEFTAVFTDSRKPVPGGLFVALAGERFDAHDFVSTLDNTGIAAVLAHRKVETELPVIYVEDTKKALLDLAAYFRGLFDIPVVGLTGSVGKTTTKEMTACVISSAMKTLKTSGNHNNDIGMPLTLMELDDSYRAAVIEMGMNHTGEISRLTKVLKPTVGMITNVGVTHIENLGSRENILAAKLEILEGMKDGSPLIINSDNDMLTSLSLPAFRLVRFGVKSECDVRATDIVDTGESLSFNIDAFGEKESVFVPAGGIHNVYNALAAVTAGCMLGIDLHKASSALEKYVPSGMRQKIVRHADVTVIEDCYNASPDSVRAAVNVIKNIECKRRVAVLGDMLELGDFSQELHRDCGKYAAENGIDMLFAYGNESAATAEGARSAGMERVFRFTDPDALAAELNKQLRAEDAVLFKASRGMKLENVIACVKWDNI